MDDASIRRASRELSLFLKPAVPFVGHALTSAAAFSLGLGITQGVGYALRVSCATPGVGPLLGMAGVGFSSMLAGEASRRYGAHAQGTCLQRRPRELASDAAMDAVVGISLFKLMGGRFRNLMPSNLLHPGACAVESLPAPGNEYASQLAKGELRRLFKRDGCHHCGVRHGKVIGDHIPPNKLVRLPDSLGTTLAQLSAGFGVLQGRAAAPARSLPHRIMQLLGGRRRSPPRLVGLLQRYYPQCVTCSGKQSAAVKASRDALVLHYYGIRPWYYAGAFVGLRHYSAARASHLKQR